MHAVWLTKLIDAATPEDLPILARTRRDLTRLLADPDVSWRQIGQVLMNDPAISVRVLHRANSIPHRHFRTEVVKLEDAAHMLGTQTIARMESSSRLAEDILEPKQLILYRRSAGRAVLAALFAYDWAQIDRDRFPSEISLAALLHNLGELYLLARGDSRMRRYLELAEINQVLNHEAEYVAFGESLENLGHHLAAHWGLSEMVREAMRARNAQHLRTLCVMLATQMARYAFINWRHPLQASDLNLTSMMLELDLDALTLRINRVISNFNETAAQYGLNLLKLLSQNSYARLKTDSEEVRQAYFCLAPRADDFIEAQKMLRTNPPANREDIILILLRGLYRGVGLNRVLFATYCPRRHILLAESLIGTDFEPSFNRFRLPFDSAGVFKRLIQQPAAAWIDALNPKSLWSQVPESVGDLIGVKSFFVMTLTVRGQAQGLIYADRRCDNCQLDANAYKNFQQLVNLTAQILERFTV